MANTGNIRPWLGPRRLSCTGACPMANGKIISFVDSCLDAQVQALNADIEATRDKAVHDISFVALNLRHDIKILNDLIRDLRQQLDHKLNNDINNIRRDAHALAVVQDTSRQDLNALATAVDQQHQVLNSLANKQREVISALAARINELREDVDRLKQGGVSPVLND